MIDIDNKIVHFDVFQEKFCCNLQKCKGKCCIEGDLGAPLTKKEITEIKKILPKIQEFLTPEAKKAIKENNFYCLDFQNEYSTSLCENSEMCVFANIDENKIYYCILEAAYNKKIIDFKKPISCHLYPIRIKKYETIETVNYDEWDICEDALIKGKEKNINVLDFLKEPLIRKYGEKWFEKAKIAEKYCKNLTK
ncbi:MAG: DUF3109 family protein [Bacteroidales bacterium]|jgi:hypothetical protein|nr:DUF3109 family protein [Bacteroidales bacterium]